jgi:hypothetical protein
MLFVDIYISVALVCCSLFVVLVIGVWRVEEEKRRREGFEGN